MAFEVDMGFDFSIESLAGSLKLPAFSSLDVLLILSYDKSLVCVSSSCVADICKRIISLKEIFAALPLRFYSLPFFAKDIE